MAKTILLADDSVTIQKVVGITFASEDVELVTVDNGDDALTRAREIRPDLVLADISMPGLSGYELCEAIKTDASIASTPVVLLTGTFESYDAERTTKAGADAHIAKPFEAQALVDLVHSLLDRPVPAAVPEAPMDLVHQPASHVAEAAVPAPPTPAPEPMPEPSHEDLSFADLEFTRDIPPPQQRVSGSDATVMMGPAPTLDPEPLPDAPAAAVLEEPQTDEPLQADGDAVPHLDPPKPVVEKAPEDAYAKTSLIDPHAAQALLNQPSTLDPSDADTFHGIDEQAPGTSEDWAYGPHRSASDPAQIELTPEPLSAFAKPAAEQPLIEEPLPDDALPAEPIAPEPVYEARLPEVPLVERTAIDDPSIPEVPILDVPELDATPIEEEPLEEVEPIAEVIAAAPLIPEPEPVLAEPEPVLAEPEPLMAEPLEPEPEPEPPVRVAEPMVEERADVSDVFGDPLSERTGPGTPLRPTQEDTAPELNPTLHVEPSVVRESIEKVAWEAFGPLSEQLVREVVKKVEEVCWDIVPELAERLVKEEIQRLTRDED